MRSRSVILFAVTLSIITYIDRVCIGQAAPAIIADLHLSKIEMGYVFSAFGLSYALMEIPGGWLCDRIGPRLVLTRIVLWWSFFTVATGWAWNLPSLVTTRFLFGAGEAGCFPAIAKMMSSWLKMDERPMAEGLKAAGARIAAAVTPWLVVSMYSVMNWRTTFAVFGGIGIVWAAVFYWWYRDAPRPLVRDETPPPFGVFVRSTSAWALCIQWFCHYYGFYFYITWLPTYLQQSRGLNIKQGALLAGLPMLSAAAGSIACGFLIPRIARITGSIAVTRKWLAYVAYGAASLLLLLFTSIADPVLAMLVMSLSSFMAELSGPVSWTTSMDLGGRFVGTLSAAMNMMGHFGGAVAPTVIGYILEYTGNNWTIAFYSSAAIYFLGVFCWMLIDPVTSLDRATTPPRPSPHSPA